MHRSKNKGLGVVTNLIMLAALAGAVNVLLKDHHESLSAIANKVANKANAMLGTTNRMPGKVSGLGGHQHGPRTVMANTAKMKLEGTGSLRIR
jgi:hypothetical protein